MSEHADKIDAAVAKYLPGFPAPLFHTRQKCREGLQEYDRARRRRLGANWAPLLSDRQDALVHPQEGQ